MIDFSMKVKYWLLPSWLTAVSCCVCRTPTLAEPGSRCLQSGGWALMAGEREPSPAGQAHWTALVWLHPVVRAGGNFVLPYQSLRYVRDHLYLTVVSCRLWRWIHSDGVAVADLLNIGSQLVGKQPNSISQLGRFISKFITTCTHMYQLVSQSWIWWLMPHPPPQRKNATK